MELTTKVFWIRYGRYLSNLASKFSTMEFVYAVASWTHASERHWLVPLAIFLVYMMLLWLCLNKFQFSSKPSGSAALFVTRLSITNWHIEYQKFCLKIWFEWTFKFNVYWLIKSWALKTTWRVSSHAETILDFKALW